MTEEESQAAAVDLANRLRLLMDVAEAESGAEPTYSQIADYLKERADYITDSVDKDGVVKALEHSGLV